MNRLPNNKELNLEESLELVIIASTKSNGKERKYFVKLD